ncbi:MAG: hypothetical protein ACRC4N_05035 [Gammaproteobacteria bacterium]
MYMSLSVCLSVCLSICLSLSLSVCLSVCLSLSLSVSLSVCLCLSLCLSLSQDRLIYLDVAEDFVAKACRFFPPRDEDEDEEVDNVINLPPLLSHTDQRLNVGDDDDDGDEDDDDDGGDMKGQDNEL